MTALFNDPAFIQHQDQVCSPNGVQPVGDHQDCFVTAQFTNCLLNIELIICVNAGRRLIKQDHRRILKNTAGNGDALL